MFLNDVSYLRNTKQDLSFYICILYLSRNIGIRGRIFTGRILIAKEGHIILRDNEDFDQISRM